MFEKYYQILDYLKQQEYSDDLKLARHAMLTLLNSDKFSKVVHDYLANIHSVGVPFTHFSHEPEQISQIKKIINALYHAELALKDVETVDLNAYIRGLKLKESYYKYHHAMHHIYQACYLLSHLDIDLADMFRQEIVLLAPMFSALKEYAESYGQETMGLWSKMDRHALPHQIGVVGGIAIDQLSPQSGEADYDFLAKFGAILPKYLDELRGYIEQFSSQVSFYEPNIDKKKLDELQDAALKLLYALDRTEGSSLLMPLKLLHYIHIIRYTITLAQSIFEQAGHLTGSAQKEVLAKLSILKYQLLPQAFGFTDKIEAQVILRPGLLTKPMMTSVSRFYQSLIYYVDKFVDFKEQGQDLVTLEDSKFVENRLLATYKRKAEASVAILSAQEAHKAARHFFSILANPKYQTLRVVELPADVKSELTRYYKLFQSYILTFDVPFNNAIISGLTGTKGYFDSWYGLNTDKIAKICEMQLILQERLAKVIASHEFHQKLNDAIIASVSQSAQQLKLFPYQGSDDPYVIVEANELKLAAMDALTSLKGALDKQPRPHTEIQTSSLLTLEEKIRGYEEASVEPYIPREQLSLEETEILFKFYEVKREKLDNACNAYDEFYQCIQMEHAQELLNFPGYDVISTDVPPTLETLHELPMATAGYVRVKSDAHDTLYYVHKLTKECKELHLNPEKRADFDACMEKMVRHDQVAKHGCVLIKVSTDPTEMFFDDLKTLTNNRMGLIVYNQCFYYLDPNHKEVELLPEDPEKKEDMAVLHVRLESLEYGQVRRAKSDTLKHIVSLLTQTKEVHLETISSITGHMHLNLPRKLAQLYGLFQPYLVGGLLSDIARKAIPKTAEEVKKIDAEMVVALQTKDLQQTIPTVFAPLLAFDESIRKRFSKGRKTILKHSKECGELFSRLTHIANDSKTLKQDESLTDRAYHVMKCQFSGDIAKFRKDLYQWTDVFNSAIKAKLQPSKKDLPFPELEDDNKRLEETIQTLAIKRLFNCLYHLEVIGKNLEALNDKSDQTTYVYLVRDIFSDLYDVINLTDGLMASPHIRVMIGDIWEKLQQSYKTLMDFSKNYIPEVAPGEIDLFTKDHSAVLLYTLNALMVLPDHITALRAGKKLTDAELKSLHQHTEKVTTDIERILASCNSSFKWFLEIPAMYQLFGELKGKIAAVASLSYDAIMDHLTGIHDDVLNKMLLEADLWENNLGFRSGTLSGPLKEILDAFFQGLLEPLQLKSAQHIELVGSMTPINNRQLAVIKRIELAKHQQKEIEEHLTLFQRLSGRMKYYLEQKGAPEHFLATLRAVMIEDFKMALPTLKTIKPLLQIDLKPGDKSSQGLDALFKDQLGSDITNVAAMVTAGHSYYKGLHASHQLTLHISEGQMSYLETLKQSQVSLNEQFVEKYTKSSFKKKAEAFATKEVGLIYCGREYSDKLGRYLQQFEEEIVSASKNEEDIDKKVGLLLREKVKNFEQLYYQQYYHLETIQSQIDHLKRYLHQANIDIQNNCSVFESPKTRRKKSVLVNHLETLASRSELDVRERVERLKGYILEPTFKTKLLEYHHYDSFTFAWLRQCFWSLVELLFLYTPAHRKCYHGLVESTNVPSLSMGQLGSLYGLFSSNKPESDDEILAENKKLSKNP